MLRLSNFVTCIIDFRNIGNLLIFKEKVLDIRPISVCVDEMTMFVHWTCIYK